MKLTARTEIDDSQIDGDLLVHVVKAGSPNRSYKAKVSNVLAKVNPLTYEALISQGAPTTSSSGTLNKGQRYLLTFAAGDDFVNVTGSPNPAPGGTLYFYALETTPTTWTHSSTCESFGEPYVVSTNVAGDISPLTNTFLTGIGFTRTSAGLFTGILTGAFPDQSKLSIEIALNYGAGGEIGYGWVDTDSFFIRTIDSGSSADEILNYTLIRIKVYP